MKKFTYIFIFIHTFSVHVQSSVEQSLQELDKYILLRDSFIQLKEKRINTLKQSLDVKTDDMSKLNIYESLFEEYKSFIYDSAYVYAQKSHEVAQYVQDKNKIVETQTNIAFCYLSSGLFKEAFDILTSIAIQNYSEDVKKHYYTLLARLYYDMADYNNGEPFSSVYVNKGIQYCDSAITYLPIDSPNLWYIVGMKRMQQRDYGSAIDAYQTLLHSPNLDDHTSAIATSSIAYMYWDMGNTERAILSMIQAAISDIKSATKETVALQNLANLLYQKGDVGRANKYVRLAMEDANFYNARQRKIQISAILPIIEKERMEMVEVQKNNLIIFAAVVSFLCVLLLISLLVIRKQIKKLGKARSIIEKQNGNLQTTNDKLLEANIIKDEYIGDFFSLNSEFIEKMEEFQKWVNRKVLAKQYDDLMKIPQKMDARREREDLYSRFDQVFLKLFPDFVDNFNDLLKPEERIELKKGELLNTDLRIYALIRLGINDNEKIAQFLNYSVNTIYTYKTKIKNKAKFSNEDFKKKVMGIKSI